MSALPPIEPPAVTAMRERVANADLTPTDTTPPEGWQGWTSDVSSADFHVGLQERAERDLAHMEHSASEPRAPTVVCVPLDVFLDFEFPPRETLLSPWLFSSSINMLTAYRGTGKTWATLSIGLAAASGGQFLSFKATAPKRVLYIDGEMPGIELQARIRKIKAMMPDFEPDNFRVINPDIQTKPLPDISTLTGQIELNAWTDTADLIVVDNLSSLARTGVENDAESWTAIATWAMRMRREGRALLFVHHAGKNGQQRGTSKREDLLDISILLSRPDDAPPGACFVWEWSKFRGIHGADAEPLRAELKTSPLGNLIWSFQTSGDARREEVRRLRADGLTVRQIAAELGASKTVIGRYAKQLETEAEQYRSVRDEE